jgi:NAD(P)-dependent dehydrogenase (short-subunit alcohol dehydrogenase family)
MIGDRVRLDDRTIVVAGAGGGGIGTAVCRAAVELGANVVGIDIDQDALAEAEVAAASPLDGGGRRFHGVLADVCDQDDVDRAFLEAVVTFGSVDGMVHVVGGQRAEHWHSLDGYPPRNLDAVFNLNVRSALLTSQAAAKAMTIAGRPGSIVHISSVASYFAAPYSLAYGVAKAALNSMTRTMAVEWGSRGVRVNGIAAGTIRTPHSRGDDQSNSERDGVLPLKRRGTPEELASAVMFMLSDLSSFVTGQTLAVDGGSMVRPSYLGPDDIPVFVEDGELRQRLAQ